MLALLFGLPLAILQRKRDIASSMIAHGLTDIIRFCFGTTILINIITFGKRMNKLFELSYKNRVLINPGNVYDYSNSQNIRISYSYTSLTDLENGLKILSKLIRKCY